MDAALFNRLSSKMRRRVNGMVARAVLSAIDDESGIQSLQTEVLDGEVHDGVERQQDYGFTSHPHPGAEATMVFVGGLRSHGLVVAVGDRRYRLKGMEQGEVAMYDDLGQVIHLKRDGILIHTDKKVTIEAGEELLIKGDSTLNIEAADDLLVKSDSMVTVQAPQVLVDSDDVRLGGDGPAVARIGDLVVAGVITTGSDKVVAA